MKDDKIIPFEKPQKKEYILPSALKMDKTLKKAEEILRSGTIHAVALQGMIDSLYTAIPTRKM
jgi:urocanate hydratase